MVLMVRDELKTTIFEFADDLISIFQEDIGILFCDRKDGITWETVQ